MNIHVISCSFQQQGRYQVVCCAISSILGALALMYTPLIASNRGPLRIGSPRQSTRPHSKPLPRCLLHPSIESPNMPHICRFEFENDRGQRLHGVEYKPDRGQFATLIWNHGVCEHKERYVPGSSVMCPTLVHVELFSTGSCQHKLTQPCLLICCSLPAAG